MRNFQSGLQDTTNPHLKKWESCYIFYSISETYGCVQRLRYWKILFKLDVEICCHIKQETCEWIFV